MPPIPKFEGNHLQAVCDVLGSTEDGLTGTEIGQLLTRCGIADSETSTKRRRLFDALNRRQQEDNCGNSVAHFLQTCMEPVRFINDEVRFDRWRGQLSYVLAFSGYGVGEDGKLHVVASATSLTEAQDRANKLRVVLTSRNIHPDVLRFCQAELLQDNYFHAVFEATKSVADKIREKSGLDEDGATLVDVAFGPGQQQFPLLVFNAFQTENERNEQRGIMNLIKGLIALFRNTHAHAPRIKWAISEQDAIDMLTLTSMLHRRLDTAIRTR
jgi:uncharacterized protein (TIGR02391 family)